MKLPIEREAEALVFRASTNRQPSAEFGGARNGYGRGDRRTGGRLDEGRGAHVKRCPLCKTWRSIDVNCRRNPPLEFVPW